MTALSKGVIGVIGASGAVGCAAASQLIKDGYECIVTYRSREIDELYVKDNSECIKLDIDEEVGLKEFCRRCSVVLNCAGPSYITGCKTAYAALSEGCGYADAFGITVFDDERIKEFSKFRPCVLGAGTVPGLSGAAAVKLSKQFDKCTSLEFYSYALENSTKTSMIDVILSSVGNYGHSDCYYSNGRIMTGNMSENEQVKVPGINDPMKSKLFLYNELIDTAKRYDIDNIRSYNLIPDLMLQNKMSEEIAAYMISKDNDTLWKCADRMCRIMETYMFGKKPEYAVSLKAEGIIKEEEKRLEMIVRMHDSLKVTGICAALAAENTLDPSMTGIHWGYEMLDFEKIQDTICNNGSCSVIIRDADEPDEEGEI